jgi:hypothetical protein
MFSYYFRNMFFCDFNLLPSKYFQRVTYCTSNIPVSPRGIINGALCRIRYCEIGLLICFTNEEQISSYTL